MWQRTRAPHMLAPTTTYRCACCPLPIRDSMIPSLSEAQVCEQLKGLSQLSKVYLCRRQAVNQCNAGVYVPQVIAGQGTISLDLMAQLPRAAVDVVFVPVGGGGLISGR